MDGLNFTEMVEDVYIPNAWMDSLENPDDESSVENILEAYFNKDDDELYVYTSGALLYRYLYTKLAKKYELSEENVEDNIRIISERIPYDEDMDFCRMDIMIEEKIDSYNQRRLTATEAWDRWLTRGFTSSQRIYVFKIAICARMEEDEFRKILVSVDGEYVNTKRPHDLIYYYAYKRGYSLSRAEQLNKLYNERLSSFNNKLEDYSDADEEFINNYLNGFDNYNVSSQLILRYLTDKYRAELGLSDRTNSEIIGKLKEIVINDYDSELYLISEDSKDWEKWMTEGFKAYQRHLAIKFAICVSMKEEDLIAMLIQIPKGSTKDEEDPYYYSYEKGYTLTEANYFYSRMKNASIEQSNSEYEKHFSEFFNALQSKSWDWRKKLERKPKSNSNNMLYDFFKKKYKVSISADEELDSLIKMIRSDYPEINCGEKTIRNWFTNGIKKGSYKNVCEFCLAIRDMSYEEYIEILYSVDVSKVKGDVEYEGVRYNFSQDYYCLYDYCKYKGYGYYQAEDLAKRWFESKHEIGLTQHFDSYIDSVKNEDEADSEFVDQLVSKSGKMNQASISNIARFARLSQYVAQKYNGANGINIKMKFDGVLPNGADLYKALYGTGYISTAMETGEGIIWDYLGEYWGNSGERFNNKYSLLMLKPTKDLRNTDVKRVELLLLLFPFILMSDRRVSKEELKEFKLSDADQNLKEREETITAIWNDFDAVMENIQDILENEVEPLVKELRDQTKVQDTKELIDDKLIELYDKYKEIFNLVLKEFGFYRFYPTYIGDRFFMINLLLNKPLSNMVNSVLDYSC